jgi:hypothetical protein
LSLKHKFIETRQFAYSRGKRTTATNRQAAQEIASNGYVCSDFQNYKEQKAVGADEKAFNPSGALLGKTRSCTNCFLSNARGGVKGGLANSREERGQSLS